MFPLGQALALDFGSQPPRGTSGDADGDPQPMIEFDGPNH
jgi:hypothetical protein